MTDSSTLLYLSRADVEAALAHVDALAAVSDVLVRHAAGAVTLPAEAYLGWTTPRGGRARSLAMPGLVHGDTPVLGTKIINSGFSNPDLGLPRAAGLTLLFDHETARPVCIMEGALVSALRTAAVSVVSLLALGPAAPQRVAVLGAGVIAETHVSLLLDRAPGIASLVVCDLRLERAEALCGRLQAAAAAAGTTLQAADDPVAAVAGAEVVVTATTVHEAYLHREHLAAMRLGVNVSLDDFDADTVLQADLLYVDDWKLIVEDDHRLLGHLARDGRVSGPGDAPAAGGRAVTGTIGQLLSGACDGRQRDDQVVMVNPFGMSICDLAVAGRIHDAAVQHEIGARLPV